ncbi:phosphoadenosine phosphosulfate reductase [Thioclava sp. L04-15]|jgi:hypothetical protein|uniref:phosphoadenosine phosphosulfate reductase n=1 Tax=Thioclava sp. L04-15 TaxID=1915318 RepID=UPI0009966A9F|nr:MULTISPECIES: phosphoadenosine phosphosulfate reductase [unclassified Thioclava]OOY26558.1 phosphoadenosine phosphosulfate reductase [Thioclava sp. L04-15]
MAKQDNSEWQARLEVVVEESGYYEPLGPSHDAVFHDDGPVLLVSFERHAVITAEDETALPRGLRLARENGWSSLTLICSDETWFRDPQVFAYFDRLLDEAFFEDFDRVVFYGAGACGYAAATFSVAAPGATVLALAPQATLDPRLAGWDDRFAEMRRTSFTDRYGFAPEMLDGVGQAFVVYDPRERLDAMHAALFARPSVTLLPCPHLGQTPEGMLRDMNILDAILTEACTGRLDAARFWSLYRARRNLPRYMRNLLASLQDTNRPYLEALVCRNVAERLNGPRFRARYLRLEADLAERGITLPAPRQEMGAA